MQSIKDNLALNPFNNSPSCKVCYAPTFTLGTLDFSKSCEDRDHKKVFPHSGIDVPYYYCSSCGLIFTDFCDNWTEREFKERIYNEDWRIKAHDQENQKEVINESYKNGVRLHVILDGLFKKNLLPKPKEELKILDFGSGGNPGDTGKALIDQGYLLDSYEPFHPKINKISKDEKYDFIYLIEVIEHCHELDNILKLIDGCLSKKGIILISTLLHPFPTVPNVLNDSGYIAPRNGHITIFSELSIKKLFAKINVRLFQAGTMMMGVRSN